MKETVKNILYTADGESLSGTPWSIYPRPRLVRDSFFCLNGEWELTATDGEKYMSMGEALNIARNNKLKIETDELRGISKFKYKSKLVRYISLGSIIKRLTL